MTATTDWQYHVKQRDHFRLMAMFIGDRKAGRLYETLAHQHGRMARCVLGTKMGAPVLAR